MIAYIYDEQKYFSGVVNCQKHPLKKGDWITPASATLVPPPDASEYSADQTPIFNTDSNKWELVDSPAKIRADKELLENENEWGVSLFERDDNGKVVPRKQSEIDAESAQIEKEFLIGQAKDQMDANIVNRAMWITKASTIESAQAFTQAFQLRANNPESYFEEGYIVRYVWGDYKLGDPLDTIEKVKEYYTGIMIELDKFRESEIAKYINYKDSL